MNRISPRFAVCLAASVANTVVAVAQSRIPVRELSAPGAKTTDNFGAILGIRPLSDGRLLINDGRRRQLSIVDATLSNKTVIVDSVAATGQSYGTRAAPLIPYLADSSLFVDWTASSLVVIGPTGNVVRVMSAPKAKDFPYIANGMSGIDAKGNLLYRGYEPYRPAKTGRAQESDSAPIIRASFETRSIDTIGHVKQASKPRVVETVEGDRHITTYMINPLATVDEWAVLSDGTVAIVSGQDYHIDFVATDGKVSASPKLAFDWKRLTDLDKQKLIDSARTDREKRESDPNASPMRVSGSAMIEAQRTGRRLTMKDGDPNFRTTEAALNDIADYWPPIRTGAAKADLDNNLWILPTTSAQSKTGELVYDVVNNNGVLFQRVRLPAGRSIAGFGRNGVVYLMYRDEQTSWYIERTTLLK